MDAWIYKVNGEEKYFGFLGAMFYEGGESLYLYINLSKDEVYGLIDNNPHPKNSPLHTKYIIDEMDAMSDRRQAISKNALPCSS
jgi:hypothetical protein